MLVADCSVSCDQRDMIATRQSNIASTSLAFSSRSWALQTLVVLDSWRKNNCIFTKRFDRVLTSFFAPTGYWESIGDRVSKTARVKSSDAAPLGVSYQRLLPRNPSELNPIYPSSLATVTVHRNVGLRLERGIIGRRTMI